MDILGVGPLEFVFVLIIMLLVLGPEGMVKAVRDVGSFLRKVVQSPVWKSIINSSQEIRQVQTQIIKESGLDESIKEIRKSTQALNEVTTNLVKPAIDGAKIDPISLKIPPAETAKAAAATITAATPAVAETSSTAEATPADPPAAEEAAPAEAASTPAEPAPAVEPTAEKTE